MSSIYRTEWTKPLPVGATIRTKGDTKVAEWTSRGRTFRGEVVGDRVRLQSGTYWARWKDADGRAVRADTGCREESNARKWLADKLGEVERERLGIITPSDRRVAGHLKAKLAEHLDDFVAAMTAAGRADCHRRTTRRYIEVVAEARAWRCLADLDRSGMEKWLAERERSGSSARSRNAHLIAIRSFLNWAIRVDRLRANLLDGIPRANERADRRRVRRALAEAELATLFQRYIEFDFDEAARVERDEAPPPPAEEFFVPVEREEPEAPRARAEYFGPWNIDRELDVQPLLTPDRDASGRPVFMTAVLDMVRRAQTSIFVQNQTFNCTGDDNEELTEFFTALRDRKRDHDVDVRVICRDPLEYPGGTEKLASLLESLQDLGFDVSPNTFRVQKKCHTKGLIIDGTEVMLGSQNFSGEGCLFNRDASLLIRDAEVAKYFEKIFLYDWDVLTRTNVEEAVAGAIERAPAGVPTPAGFRRVTLADLLGES